MAETIKLPDPQKGLQFPLMEALEKRRTTRKWRDTPVSDQDISNMLWAACGITKNRQGKVKCKRTAPSACNAQEIRVYVLLEKGVFLYNEEHHERHENIIRILTGSRYGLTRSEIVTKSKLLTGGTLTYTLAELEQSEFITSYQPLYKRTKDTVYRLTDEYSLFYLRFIQDSKSTGAGTWMRQFSSPSYKIWSGLSFESLCLKHQQQIRKSLGIDAIFATSGTWRYQDNDSGAQIDLLIDRADNIINLCEMKFYNAEFSITK